MRSWGLALLLVPLAGMAALDPALAQNGGAAPDTDIEEMAPLPGLDLDWPDLAKEEPSLPAGVLPMRCLSVMLLALLATDPG